MHVTIQTIPHKDQRYPTIGDWIPTDEQTLVIRVSNMDNWRYEMLVAIHELVEALLCKDRGITEEAVFAFDVEFESNREPGDDREPGDQPDAPYRREHFEATVIEMQMAVALGVDWNDYCESTEKLG